VKVGLDCGQSDIDHRAIDERHTGSENGRNEDPCIPRLLVPNSAHPGSDYGFVARRSHVAIDAPFKMRLRRKLEHRVDG
jgi:hypothetical protein